MKTNIPFKQYPSNPGLTAWLRYAGSFMRRLKRHGIHDARIEVLEQSWQVPKDEERSILGLEPRKLAIVREVLIRDDKNLWMFARSVFPQETLKGLRQLATLKNRSLGSVLFKNPNVKRGELDIMPLHPQSEWYQKANQFLSSDREVLWARRSLFSHHHRSLLLLEVFLPDIEKL